MATLSRSTRRQHRHHRVRQRIRGTAARPRLAVFRSAKHISAQLIDDVVGKTLIAVTDGQLGAGPKGGTKLSRKVAIATAVGMRLAEQAKVKKISTVVFDASGYRYHGRVQALADGARAGGLQF